MEYKLIAERDEIELTKTINNYLRQPNWHLYGNPFAYVLEETLWVAQALRYVSPVREPEMCTVG